MNAPLLNQPCKGFVETADILLRRAYSLAAVDAQGCSYDFVIKSWANGTEHRRVYVLEQAAPFIKAHALAAGDAVGICTNGSGSLTILANTPEVLPPPQYSRGCPAVQPLHYCRICHPRVEPVLQQCIAEPHLIACTCMSAAPPGACSDGASGAGGHGGAACDGGAGHREGAAVGHRRPRSLLHPHPALHQARQPPR